MRALLMLICALALSACEKAPEILVPEEVSGYRAAPGYSVYIPCNGCNSGYHEVIVSSATPGLATVTKKIAQGAWVECNTDGYGFVSFFNQGARVGTSAILECGTQDNGLCYNPLHAPTPMSARYACQPAQTEPAITATVGHPFSIPVPGGFPQVAYVTTPRTETVSNIAAFEPQPDRVDGACNNTGEVWVKVLTGNGYWKIYPLTCEPPRLEPSVTGEVGNPLSIPVAGGPPQKVYVTAPYSETVSSVAAFQPKPDRVEGGCNSTGEVWVKVLTGNGYWKIYPLTCEPLRPESTVTGYLGESVYISVPGGSPGSVSVTIPRGDAVSDVASFAIDGSGVRGHCTRVGDAWVRVVTGTGYWKIYPLACRQRHDQGGIG